MFKATEYRADLFGPLLGLLKRQADHHGEIFAGDLAKLRDEFEASNGHTKAILIEHSTKQQPVGLAVVHELHNTNGKGLYLEDLYIAEEFRKSVRGTGSFAFGHLIRMARAEDYDFVNWLVAEDNEDNTFKFYTGTCEAQTEKVNLLSLSKKFNYTSTPPQSRFNTRIDQLATGNHKLSIIDAHGDILASAYLNDNFSTFRTVTGLRVEPELPDHHHLSANDNFDAIYEALHLSIIEYARNNNKTGHIAWAVPQNVPKLEQFLRRQGLSNYCLDESDPDTKLLPFKIDRTSIDSDLMERLQKLPKSSGDDNTGLQQAP